ncbi:MAG TPA: helix-turn-helix transcriptional regulator [Chitinophagaceae bacterium]|nr:helix-turn-helix transcriptional regulator [Chitinophagaceae bacterium]
MRDIICEKLKFLREKNDYSQEDVADALHISQNTYSLLETGKTKLDIERLFEIAEFYKVPVYYLLDIPPAPAKKDKYLLKN